MIKAVSFDAHGTIILPQPSIGAIYSEIALIGGMDPDLCVPADIDQRFPVAFRAVTKHWPVPYGHCSADAQAFWHAVIRETFMQRITEDTCEQLFQEFARGARWRVLPGVREAMAWLRERSIPMVVCSNFDARLRQILSEHALHFDSVSISAEVGAAKPDPAIILHACRAIGIAPENVLHIGDHPTEDALAAEAAGCTFQLVERGAGIDLTHLQHWIADADKTN